MICLVDILKIYNKINKINKLILNTVIIYQMSKINSLEFSIFSH